MPFARKPVAALTRSALESRIRRAAAKYGCRAVKSRWRRGTPHNQGGWQIIAEDGQAIKGLQYDLSDDAALKWLS
jgi:hypothetical protein